MEFHDELHRILRSRPFNCEAQPALPLNALQCRFLALLFSSHIDIFFGTSNLHRSTPFHGNSLSDLHVGGARSKWWSAVNMNPSTTCLPSPSSSDYLSTTLHDLRRTPLCIEELYRVLIAAQNFLLASSRPDWWRTAASVGLTTEVRDVLLHDLLWCMTGLNLAFVSIRGANLPSRTRFSRLKIAHCHAKFERLSLENSDLRRREVCDNDSLVSRIERTKQKYEEMNFIRKKVMSLEEKLKEETICFLSKKLTPPSFNTEVRSTSTPPQNMQIRIEDLVFTSPPRLVGRGSFGSVYEASWLGRKVAAKQFAYDTCKLLFEHEAAILADLQCPFIVQMFGWCVDSQNNVCYLILEFASNNLTYFVAERSKPLRLHVVVELMLQISRGMEYMHSRKIMHRDLKPGNVLVEPMTSCKQLMDKGYARVKLCDFGFARPKLEIWNSMTWQVGTMCYMAPEVWAPPFRNDSPTDEQAVRANYSFEADVYSFAMTFAYTLTRKQPFADIRSGSQLLHMLGKGVRPKLPEDCPRFLEGFIQSCWSNNPSSRPSFSDISMALKHLKLQLMRSSIPEQPTACLSDEEIFLSSPTLSYQELSAATDGFTRRVQYITLDSIYYGVLSDETVVLVQDKGNLVDPRKVWAEVSQTFDLRHTNVAYLRAVCIHCSQYWFLYEYTCVRGSLDLWLEHAPDKSLKPLDAVACCRVAIGVACGLQYLHEQKVLCAVTSKNILLDEHFEPQILMDSSVCEAKVDCLSYRQCLDVVHFGNLIGQLLLHLHGNGVDLENRLQFSYASLLKEVECFCLGNRELTMDEVVELLMTKIDGLELDGSAEEGF